MDIIVAIILAGYFLGRGIYYANKPRDEYVKYLEEQLNQARDDNYTLRQKLK